MKKLLRPLLRWWWHDASQSWRLQLTPWTRNYATVWPNGVWHTWLPSGCGGENGTPVYEGQPVWSCKIRAYESCLNQGLL